VLYDPEKALVLGDVMITRSRTALLLIFAASALAACKSENGYVEIKRVPVPSRAQPPMYLDSNRLPQITKGTVVLAHPYANTI
jgi:hypothetical protein